MLRVLAGVMSVVVAVVLSGFAILSRLLPGAVSAKGFSANPPAVQAPASWGVYAITQTLRAVSRYSFRLFIAGDSLRSRQAVANLKRLGEERLGGRYELTVVDVISDPASAEAARVLTTPTLVKEAPTPPRRVTGDLTDAVQVMMALGLDSDHDFRTE